MKCPSCGKQRAPGDMFCDGPDGCGFPLPQRDSNSQQLNHLVIGEIICPQPGCGRANSSINSFCYYCGAPLVQKAEKEDTPPDTANKKQVRAKLVSGDKEIPIIENPTWISRNHFKGLISEVETNYISRRHFAISSVNGIYFAEDSSSANSTWVNGVEIRGMGKYKLKNGDKINVGGVITVAFKTS